MDPSEVKYANETLWNNILLGYTIVERLSDWQRSQLNEIKTDKGVHCLITMWFNYTHLALEGIFCNAVWDDVYCWPPTPSGTRLTQPCSEALKITHPQYAPYLTGNAFREGLDNGTWSLDKKSNYDACANSFDDFVAKAQEKQYLTTLVQYMLFYGSIFSLLSLSVCLLIYYKYRCLWCDRIIVHSHLMVALALRFILLFMISEPYVLERHNSYKETSFICRSIIIVYLFATVSSVSWMFIQGYYLNRKLTTRVLSAETQIQFRLYYIIGWGVPAGLTLVYFLFMVFSVQQDKCWKGYADMTEIWIILGPMIFVLLTNAIFLVNILRVILEKVRNTNTPSDSSQIVAAGKATFMLFPVLGLNNLLLLYNPGGDYEIYYVTLNAFFGSTQGIFVSIVYCFCNGEVQNAIRRSYNRMIARRDGTFVSRTFNSRQENREPTMMMMMVDIPQQNIECDEEIVQSEV